MRALAALAMSLALSSPLVAQEQTAMVPAPPAAPAPLQQSLGLTYENDFEAGNQDLTRLPLVWSLDATRRRTTLLEVEPSLGWHTAAGVTDASGLSYTRIRFYHLLGGGAVTIGPDIETFLKTESDVRLAYGYYRLMPGVQASWQMPRGWRATLRTRYEFSAGEDSGVAPLARIVVRPTMYAPPIGRWSFWVRGDIAFDVHGAPNQYNVEGLAAVRPDARRRLMLFVEPRVYVGAASRTRNLWRLRSGFRWSLGDLALHHEGS